MKRVFSLDGSWRFRRLSDSTLDRTVVPTKKPGERILRVPSNWYLEGEDFAGCALYTRTFPAPHPQHGRAAFLRVKGSDYFTTARLNGVELGRHEGYFQTFEFDATAALKESNVLELEVSSPKENRRIWPHQKHLIKGIFNHHDARPGSWDVEHGQDRNTGGLWGGVDLVVAEGVIIRSVRVTPKRLKDGRAEAEVRLALLNLGGGAKFDLHALFVGDNFRCTPEKARPVRLFLPPGASDAVVVHTFRKPHWWWTWDQGRPDLYRLSVSVREAVTGREVERETARFGLREIRVSPDWEFTLNGRRFFPRGSNIIPTQFLSEYGPENARRDVDLIRQANLNFIRVHAHVNRREFYEACDEAGVMVWQDFALQWSYERSKAFVRNACRQIKDMVRQFYNHPSIGVWCCHNEPSVNRYDLDPILWSAASEEDAGRHVDVASDFRYHPYPGWYWVDSANKDSAGVLNADLKFVSEFGAQALPDVATLKKMFSPRELWPPDWKAWAFRDFQFQQTFNVARIPLGRSLAEFVRNSQAYQARLIKDYIESCRIRKYKPLQGLFHFMFVDCWMAITWSVLDYTRRPKAGYHALKTACQPLLPIWRNIASRVNPGWKMNWGGRFLRDLTVVNDFPRGFKNLRADLAVLNPRGKVLRRESGLFSVGADTVVRPFATDDHHGDKTKPLLAPEKGPLGDYTVRVRLLKGRRILAENTEIIRVVSKKTSTRS